MVNDPVESKKLEIQSDPSDQSVWRHFLSHVFELPQIYNAQKHANFSAEGWEQVLLVHDIDVHRNLRLPSARVDARLREVTVEAHKAVRPAPAKIELTLSGWCEGLNILAYVTPQVREVCNSNNIKDRG